MQIKLAAVSIRHDVDDRVLICTHANVFSYMYSWRHNIDGVSASVLFIQLYWNIAYCRG